MRTSQHTRADRLRIAKLAGTISRRATQLAANECTLQQAVAELHSISADPHLLSHAPAAPAHWQYDDQVAIAVAAGTTRATIEETWTEQATWGTPRGSLD